MKYANPEDGPRPESPFARVASLRELPQRKGRRVVVEGRDVALFRVGDEVFALRDRCTHARSPLSSGRVKDGPRVACPRHGAEFDLRTGRILSLQAVRNVEVHEVRIHGDDVFVHPRSRVAEPLWVTGTRLDELPEGTCCGGSRESCGCG